MMPKQEIKRLAEEFRKKIGIKTIKKINKMISQKTEEIMKKAARNADFAGRKTIKEEDVLEV